MRNVSLLNLTVWISIRWRSHAKRVNRHTRSQVRVVPPLNTMKVSIEKKSNFPNVYQFYVIKIHDYCDKYGKFHRYDSISGADYDDPVPVITIYFASQFEFDTPGERFYSCLSTFKRFLGKMRFQRFNSWENTDLLSVGVRFDMLPQRRRVSISFIATLDRTRIRFLK